jgi:hypothetical protein
VQFGGEIVQLLIGRNTFPLSPELLQLLRTIVLLRFREGRSRFEIVFAVQTGGFDEGVASFNGTCQEDHVHGKQFSLQHQYDISDFDLAPFDGGELVVAIDVGNQLFI